MKHDDYVLMTCVGPGKHPNDLPCIHGDWKSDPKKITSWHKMKYDVDTLPYNGIVNWRCSKCFDEHRKLIRK